MNRVFANSLLFSLTILLSLGIGCLELINKNLNRLRVVQEWLSIEMEGMEDCNNALNDGIPDDWQIHFWGGARQIYSVEEQDVFLDKRSVRIEHMNDQGVAALTQRVTIRPNTRLVGKVYAKGDGGAIQFRFRTATTENWIGKGWCEIPPSEDWRQYELTVIAPPETRKAALYLRGGNGTIFFDEAYVGTESNGTSSTNLLANPGFEQDGVSEDPLEWWRAHIALPDSLTVPEDETPDGVSYLNIVDMLAGRYDAIQRRSLQLEDICASTPEMTSWLIALGDRFEREGGKAARERLYQLAIELIPNCPQSYAALAGLYRTSNAFPRAAEFYRRAAELSDETALAGKYSFEEGLIHVRYTGLWELAVLALQKAERLGGWESGDWYWGAASLYLGRALEAQGRFVEAADAYQRVIDCERCSYHYEAAQERLDGLVQDSNSE